MKLLRTIRFDTSDSHVFARAAPEGEWAVSGAFAFADLAPDTLSGKTRQAFANGFLGLPSLGRATFVTVATATEADAATVKAALAAHFVAAWGAPSVDAARPAAEAEVGFAAELAAEAEPGTVLTVSRSFDEAGALREAFRSIRRPGNCGQSRVWDIVESPTP